MYDHKMTVLVKENIHKPNVKFRSEQYEEREKEQRK